MQKMRGTALLAAVAMTVSGLAACGNDAEPIESTSTKSPRTPVGGGRTSEASETPSSSSSGAGTADTPKGMPAAAKKNTKAGAAAFGEYYVDQHGEAIHSGNAAILESLGTGDCRACVAAVRQIKKDAGKGWTRNTNPYTYSNVMASQRPDEGYKVKMKVRAKKYYRLNENGDRNGTIDPVEFDLAQHVVWNEGRWQMASWIATQE